MGSDSLFGEGDNDKVWGGDIDEDDGEVDCADGGDGGSGNWYHKNDDDFWKNFGPTDTWKDV